MEINTDRNEQLKKVAEATVYFKEHGLTYNFEAFFTRDAVKRTLHEIYVVFTADAEKIVSNLPGPAKKRGNRIFATISEREHDYVMDVKDSFLCTIFNLLNWMKDFVDVDDVIIQKFNQALVAEPEGKMLDTLHEIANELAGILLEEFQAAVSLPSGLPPEVANVLLSISNGKPMVTMQEIEDFRRENLSATDESHEGTPRPRLYHPKKYE